MTNRFRRGRSCIFAAVGIAAPAIPACAPWPGSGPVDAFTEIAAESRPAAGAPVMISQPVFDSIPDKSGSHAPTVCVLPNGGLLAAWYSYAGPGELDGAEIFGSRLDPGANSWMPPERLVHAATSAGNPVLYSEGADIRLFYAVVSGAWGSAQVFERDSQDAGASWTNERNLRLGIGVNIRFAPARLDDNQLILPAYDELFQRSLFYVEKQAGGFVRLSSVFSSPPTQNLQPSIVQRADGSLLAVLRNQGRGDLLASVSADRGRTWAAPLATGFNNPNSPAQLLRLLSGALALIFNDSRTDRHPLSIAISNDDGRTWSAPRNLVDGPGEYAYPGAVATRDGLVHIVYSHNRERIQYLRLDEAMLVTSDFISATGADALAIRFRNRLSSHLVTAPRP